MEYAYLNIYCVEYTIVLYIYGTYHPHLIRKREGERTLNLLDDYNAVMIREWRSIMDFSQYITLKWRSLRIAHKRKLPRTLSLFLSLSFSILRVYTGSCSVHRPVQRCRLYGPYFNFSCCITPLYAHENEMHRQGRSNWHFTLFNAIIWCYKILLNLLVNYKHLNTSCYFSF